MTLVRLVLAAPRSQVKHSTTEPLIDLLEMFSYDLKMKIAWVKVFRIIFTCVALAKAGLVVGPLRPSGRPSVRPSVCPSVRPQHCRGTKFV